MPLDKQPVVVILARLRTVLAAFLLLAVVRAAAQADAFVVDDIRLEGLQRITAGTVFNYLPINVGDTVDGTRTAEALRALFGTGFFRDVRLERDGDTLVVSVVERPSIGSIEFSGNEELKTEDLLSALEQMGFAQGRVFNRSIFDQVKQELHRTYFATGKYAARITGTATPLERNRVAVKFEISEGVVAKIRQINIVGNDAFDDDDLRDDFELDTTGFFSFITRSDRYSKPKLAADLETLRTFYLDQGFINFSLDSTQVSITPDKQDVYVTINITEGGRYVVRDVYLQGALIVPDEELFDLVTVVQGGEFSRKHVTETARRIGNRLGIEGYSFANVNAVPEIDEAEKKVDLTFFVDPGKRVYVRRINFKGNVKTRDEVLRREMRQMESGWISTELVERSRVRLNRLGFFESVAVQTPAVSGTSDQVDVDFTVVERPSGNLLLGAGYSDSQGAVFDISVTEENVLGSGNRLRASFNTSKVSRDISVSWLNPYWTVDGVSRGLDIYNRRTDASDANLADYNLDQIGTGATFGIPISEFTRVNLGFNVEQTDFIVGSTPSYEVFRFAQRERRPVHHRACHCGLGEGQPQQPIPADPRQPEPTERRNRSPGQRPQVLQAVRAAPETVSASQRLRVRSGGRARLWRRLWRDRRSSPDGELLRRGSAVGAWLQGQYARSARVVPDTGRALYPVRETTAWRQPQGRRNRRAHSPASVHEGLEHVPGHHLPRRRKRVWSEGRFRL